VSYCLSTRHHSVKETKFWSPYECKCYNTWQFMTEFPVKGWTKNSINRLLVKVRMFGTVDRRPGSSRWHSAHTDENVDTVESLLLSHEDKPQSHRTVKRNFTWGRGRSINHQFRGLFTKICVSSAARKGTLNSWLKQIACTCYFRYAVWEMITWQHENWKSKLYSRVFWIFLPNVIKIDPYTSSSELYCFKVGAFFRDTVVY